MFKVVTSLLQSDNDEIRRLEEERSKLMASICNTATVCSKVMDNMKNDKLNPEEANRRLCWAVKDLQDQAFDTTKSGYWKNRLTQSIIKMLRHC